MITVALLCALFLVFAAGCSLLEKRSSGEPVTPGLECQHPRDFHFEGTRSDLPTACAACEREKGEA